MTDIFYYNIIMNGVGIQSSSLAEYDDQRTQNIINNAGDYLMSVVRFSIDASHIPLFVCPVIYDPVTPTNINNTPYTITLKYNNIDYTRNVQFIPNTKYYFNLPNAPTINGSQDDDSEYYYVWYYSSFLDMVNRTIEKIYNDISNIDHNLQNLEIPYFQFDVNSGLISLVVPDIVYGATTDKIYRTQFDINGNPIISPQPINTIQIFCNSRLYHFFDGIPTYLTNSINSVSYRQFLFLITDLHNNTINNKLVLSQEYQNIGGWNSLSSIVFITSFLPIQHEYIPNIVDGLVEPGSSYRTTLTDFVPDVSDKIGSNRGRFHYNPSAQFRMIQLKSSSSINRIDIKMFWTDKFNKLHQMRISNGETNSVKLMFVKKNLYFNNFNKQLL